jgi:Peptidase family M28
MRRGLAVAVPLLAVLALVHWRLRGPEPLPASAPANVFSAARAHAVLSELVAENVPHPLGSAANARVRDRVVARFRELGYPVRVQRRFACNAAALCGTVENVIAGDLSRDAVVLTAHYDSVGAGPGASDDAAGVAAIVEIARALRGQRFRNPIAFLITDGEEAGLLGAEGFVADAESSRHAKMIIGIEYRGTSGPSFMFETSQRNGWLIRHVAASLDRPFASSLFWTIYDLMPNDSDLTVFKRAGRDGVNFGAIGDVVWYHTPLDDLAHVNPRTLQYHGENGLAIARSLADADLDARSPGNAVFFDVLSFFVVRWPEAWTIWIALASFALLLAGARKANARAITIGVVVVFATILAAAVAGWVIAWLAQLRSGGVTWMAAPQWAVAAAWLAGVAASMIAWRGKTHPLGYAMVWHAAAIVLAMTLPGTSYLFLVPAIVMSLCAIAGASVLVTSIAASVASALLLFPVATMLYTALGGLALPIIAVLIAFVVMLAAPAIANTRAALAAFALALVCAVVSIAMPKATQERPRRLTLSWLDDASQARPMWIANDVTPAMRAAAAWGAMPRSIAPWNPAPARYSAPAEAAGLPRVAITRTGNTIHVRSPRNAERVTLSFRSSAPIRGIRVNGIAPPPRPARFRDRGYAGWQFALVHGAAMDVTIDTDANAKIEAAATDSTSGLPAASAGLARARSASSAVPSHEGDVTMTRAWLR